MTKVAVSQTFKTNLKLDTYNFFSISANCSHSAAAYAETNDFEPVTLIRRLDTEQGVVVSLLFSAENRLFTLMDVVCKNKTLADIFYTQILLSLCMIYSTRTDKVWMLNPLDDNTTEIVTRKDFLLAMQG